MSSKRLANKVGVVTGASSGVGRAIAMAYAREGAKVVCADLRPSARSEVPDETKINTHDLIKKEGGSSLFIKTDVGVAKEMDNLIQQAADRFGRVDIMVNNAGISIEAQRPPAASYETDEDVWDTTMRINAKSVFLGSKYAAAQMMKQNPHPNGDRGWIVNISSILGLVGDWAVVSYSASKGAVTNMTRSIALDCAPHKIRCNAICPGYTQTAIFVNTTSQSVSFDALAERHPLNGPGKPEDIAKMAVVLASEDANWVTGANIAVDGGYTAR